MFAQQDLATQLVAALKKDIPAHYLPPAEGAQPATQMVLPASICKGTRGYIEKIVSQINGCYEKGWYDGCAVMMRRLLETLIIEVFEHYRLDKKIKNSSGDFFYLSDLVSAVLNEPSWNLGRNTKKSLPKLKTIGDFSAHSRRFMAHRQDIETLISDFRVVVQELVFLANLK